MVSLFCCPHMKFAWWAKAFLPMLGWKLSILIKCLKMPKDRPILLLNHQSIYAECIVHKLMSQRFVWDKRSTLSPANTLIQGIEYTHPKTLLSWPASCALNSRGWMRASSPLSSFCGEEFSQSGPFLIRVAFSWEALAGSLLWKSLYFANQIQFKFVNV